MFHKTLHEHEWCTNNIPETACVASPVRVSGFSAPPMPLNAYSTLKNRAIQLYTSTSTTSTRPRLAESSSYVLGVGRRGLRTRLRNRAHAHVHVRERQWARARAFLILLLRLYYYNTRKFSTDTDLRTNERHSLPPSLARPPATPTDPSRVAGASHSL